MATPRYPDHMQTPEGAPMNIDLLWFEDCPNHHAAELMLREALDEVGVPAHINRIEVADEATGNATIFPGSPTIRVNGHDVEPGWTECEDCTPRCRLYATAEGLRGLPERRWIVDAVRAAAS